MRPEAFQLDKAIMDHRGLKSFFTKHITNFDTNQSMDTGGANKRARKDDDDGADGRCMKQTTQSSAHMGMRWKQVSWLIIMESHGSRFMRCGNLPTHHTPCGRPTL